MHYILGDIQHTKCCTDLVYFTAGGSYTSCPTLKAKLYYYYQVPCQAKDRDEESWECLVLSCTPGAVGSPYSKCCSWEGKMSKGASSQFLAPTLTGRGSSTLLATGRVCARSQGWCDWAFDWAIVWAQPPQLVRPARAAHVRCQHTWPVSKWQGGTLCQAVGGPCIGNGSCKNFRNPSLGKTLTSLQSTQWKTSKNSRRDFFPNELPSKIPI